MNIKNNKVFGFDKTGYSSDSEIEALYQKKSELVTDKTVKDKLFKASLYDPRKSDIYFSSVESANKGKEIANKLHRMTTDEFLGSNYSYQWLDELSGASIFKIVNKNVLKQQEGGGNMHLIKKLLQFVRIHCLWVLIALITIFIFYWFQYRPVKIRSYCDWKTKSESYWRVTKSYDANYSSCLHEKGLK